MSNRYPLYVTVDEASMISGRSRGIRTGARSEHDEPKDGVGAAALQPLNAVGHRHGRERTDDAYRARQRDVHRLLRDHVPSSPPEMIAGDPSVCIQAQVL